MPKPSVTFLPLTQDGHNELIERSKILAVFVDTGSAYGLMVNGKDFLTRAEREALILAAQELPTRD